MAGTLDRLFRYAKSTGKSQLENFTTEAMAVAIIRAEPRVFVASLASAGLAPAFETVELVHVETQVHVPGGIVDLVIEFMIDGLPRTFWVEAKAHARLHGPQLQMYRNAATNYPGLPKQEVIMLCKAAVDGCGADAAVEHAAPDDRDRRAPVLAVNTYEASWRASAWLTTSTNRSA